MTQQDQRSDGRKAATDDALNEALKDTFPASDPVSITRAARGEPSLGQPDDDDGHTDEEADGTDIETAEDIGFASEAGNR